MVITLLLTQQLYSDLCFDCTEQFRLTHMRIQTLPVNCFIADTVTDIRKAPQCLR